MNSSLKIFDSIVSDLETQIYHLENQIGTCIDNKQNILKWIHEKNQISFLETEISDGVYDCAKIIKNSDSTNKSMLIRSLYLSEGIDMDILKAITSDDTLIEKYNTLIDKQIILKEGKKLFESMGRPKGI